MATSMAFSDEIIKKHQSSGNVKIQCNNYKDTRTMMKIIIIALLAAGGYYGYQWLSEHGSEIGQQVNDLKNDSAVQQRANEISHGNE